MSDILRQVDEDLRKQKFTNLWKRYGIYLIVSILIIVFSVVGYQVKKSSDMSNNEKLIEMYIAATYEKGINNQIQAFDDLVGSKNDYISGLAELRLSNLQIQNGDKKEGINGLKNIINNNKYDAILVDLAVYLLLLNKIDEIDEPEFMRYLEIAKSQDSNFKFLFEELFLIKKLLLGKNEESKIGFKKLIDSVDAPLNIKIRAEKFIEIAE